VNAPEALYNNRHNNISNCTKTNPVKYIMELLNQNKNAETPGMQTIISALNTAEIKSTVGKDAFRFKKRLPATLINKQDIKKFNPRKRSVCR